MAIYDQAKLHNSNTGIAKICDVLSRTDKSLRVVFPGTNIPLTLTRSDRNRPFVGHLHGMEFTSHG